MELLSNLMIVLLVTLSILFPVVLQLMRKKIIKILTDELLNGGTVVVQLDGIAIYFKISADDNLLYVSSACARWLPWPDDYTRLIKVPSLFTIKE